MDFQSASEENGNDSGYLSDFSNLPDESVEDGILELDNICLSDLETDEVFLDATSVNSTSDSERSCDDNTVNVLYEHQSINIASNCVEEDSQKKSLSRKTSPRLKNKDQEYDEKTMAAIDALFHVLIFHDNCDLFCSKAEETWFWEKCVSPMKFMTAKTWFKELVFYYKKFKFYLPVILSLVEGKTEVELRIPSSMTMEVHFPWELFQIGGCGDGDNNSVHSEAEESVVPTSAEKLKESNECIYICDSRLRKLDVSVRKLLSKFEALLILSSPVGHHYNKATFLGRRKSNEGSLKDPFDDPITLI